MIEKKINKMYTKEIAKYGINDRRSLFWTKDKQDNRFNILLDEKLKCSKMTILDYGCGVADLKNYLTKNFYNLSYSGCDINDAFIKEAKSKFPDTDLYIIQTSKDIKGQYDIILVSGTFNLIGIDDYDCMKQYVYDNIYTLFEKCNYMLTVNFLSHTTDDEYKYKGHFYLDPMELYKFSIKKMTTRIHIDTYSLPFEITMKFYKNMDFNDKVLYKDV
jgi:SAM-dependent methyltransferase